FMPVSNAEVEYVTKRNLSFNYSFSAFSYQPSRVIRKNNKYSINAITTTIQPYESQGFLNSFGVKYYFNKIVPAPLGFYTALDFGIGGVYYGYEYKRTRDVYDYNFSFDPTGEELINEGRKKSANYFYHISLPSIGYQTVLNRYLTIDAKFAFEGFLTEMPTNFEYSYLTTNIYAMRIGSLIYGPAIYLKAGILLF
ncbi:MAG: hypothetical protein H0X62_13475, partial [Bacteroidetes bacterium]|nr:hypothetical protein [Bacteroidota bacterium]